MQRTFLSVALLMLVLLAITATGAAAELNGRGDAEKGHARCELSSELPGAPAPQPLAPARGDAELANRARLHHRHEQRAHRRRVATRSTRTARGRARYSEVHTRNG